MAKARALDTRRKAIANIRKITRTMELIATARFKKAMDRAQASTAFTRRITQLVADLAQAGLETKHPLLEPREETKRATILVLTSNRGLCGGYNGQIIRMAAERIASLTKEVEHLRVEVSGKRGIAAFKFRGQRVDTTYTKFEDKPTFIEVDEIATRYLDEYLSGKLDRLDVVYTKFQSASKQFATIETLLPLGSLDVAARATKETQDTKGAKPEAGSTQYEFLPSAESILEEVVPMSFKIKLFKCFLDAGVSEQIARMVAMKSATDSANKMYKNLSTQYNRARQGQITSELLEIMGGAEALKK